MSELDDSLCEEEDTKQNFFRVHSLKESPCGDTNAHSYSLLQQKNSISPRRVQAQPQDGTDFLIASQELDDSLDDEQFKKLSQLQSPSFLQQKVTSDCLKKIKCKEDLWQDEEAIDGRLKQPTSKHHFLDINQSANSNINGNSLPRRDQSPIAADTIHRSPTISSQNSVKVSSGKSPCLLLTPVLLVEKVKPNFGKKLKKQPIPAGLVDEYSGTNVSMEDSERKKKKSKSVKTGAALSEQRLKEKMKKSVNKNLETSAASKTKLTIAVKNSSTETKNEWKEAVPFSSSSVASAKSMPCVIEDPEIIEMLDRSSKKPGPEPKPPKKKIPKKPVFLVKKQLTESPKALEILKEHCSDKKSLKIIPESEEKDFWSDTEICKMSSESEESINQGLESQSKETSKQGLVQEHSASSTKTSSSGTKASASQQPKCQHKVLTKEENAAKQQVRQQKVEEKERKEQKKKERAKMKALKRATQAEAEKLDDSSMQQNCSGMNTADLQEKAVPKFKRAVLTKEEKAERKQKIEEKRREKEQKRIEREQKKKEREDMNALKKNKQEALKALREEKKAELKEKERKTAKLNDKKSSFPQERKLAYVDDSYGEGKVEKKTKQSLVKGKKSSACYQEKSAANVEDSGEVNKAKKDKKSPREESTYSAFPGIKKTTDIGDSSEFHMAVFSPSIKEEESLISPMTANFDGLEINFEALKDVVSMTTSPFMSPVSLSCGKITPNSNMDSEDALNCDRLGRADSGIASDLVSKPASKRPLSEDTTPEDPKPKKLKIGSSTEPELAIYLETSSENKCVIVIPDSPRSVSTRCSSPCKPAATERKAHVKTCMKGNTTGPVWVQCCNMWCHKWRQLKDHFDPLTVPVLWKCSDNMDIEHNDCSLPTEKWMEYENEDFQFVESAYVPGSVVWGKMDSYPWWPAMVEADPDDECYFEMGQSNSTIPVKYHVVFFGTPVSRSWLYASRVIPFTDVADANEMHHSRVANSYKKGLEDSKKEASRALELPVKGRLEANGFLVRHKAPKKLRKPGSVTKEHKPAAQMDIQEVFKQRSKTKFAVTKAERKAVVGTRMKNKKRERSKWKVKITDSIGRDDRRGIYASDVDANMVNAERQGSVKSDEEEQEEEDEDVKEKELHNGGGKMDIMGDKEDVIDMSLVIPESDC